jgi:hypothetical protein
MIEEKSLKEVNGEPSLDEKTVYARLRHLKVNDSKMIEETCMVMIIT